MFLNLGEFYLNFSSIVSLNGYKRFYPGIGLFYNVMQAVFYLCCSLVNKARIDVSSNFRGQTTFGFDFVCAKRPIWKFLLLLETRAVENDFQFAL